jgi:hypothetical protein
MAKYRRRMPEVEAFQLTMAQLKYIEKYGCVLDAPTWVEDAVEEGVIARNEENRIFVDKSKYGIDGTVEVGPYDYIVKNEYGEIVAWGREDFDNTFEEVR